nr:reverse transcriptase domain-containing protein [Tanacetum cinerariifolium]
MADNRTMEELLQEPTKGYGEAIVILKIDADHFEIKKNLLQLVQANPYHGFERENPHTHINNFKRTTSNLKFRDVLNDVIKLMMFPYSLEGSVRVWYDKEPPNFILTWEDLVNKFVNQFFPPSKTTYLKNEISHFNQRFEETFGEAWERFKEMLRACPHHGFTRLAQINTFYNGLNDNDQDSLNAVAGGNLLSKTTREALQIIENKSKVRYSRNKPNVSRMNTTSRENASKSDDKIDTLANQISSLVDIFAKKVVTPAPVKAVEESCVTCGGNHAYYNCPNTNSNQLSVCVATCTYNLVAPQNHASNYMAPPCFAPVQNSQNRFNQNQGQGNSFNRGNNFRKPDVTKTLPKPNIPYPSRLNDHKLRKKATNQMETFFQIFQDLHFDISFADALLLMPKFASTIKSLLTNKDKDIHFSTDFVVVDFKADPRIPLILGRSFLGTGCALIDVYGEEITLRVSDAAVTFNLNQTTRYSSTYDDLLLNRIDIIDVAREEYAQEILGFFNNSLSGNPTSTSEPIISDSSPSLTPFEGSDFILEEIEAYLKDESISLEIDHAKSSIKEPLELELKDLPSHLEYAYPEGVDKLPVIIAKDLKDNEKEALLKKILMEEDYKPAVQSQRWVRPKIHEVSPIHYVPKKGGITVVENKNNELIPTRFIQDFSKIARPMTHLLEKETPFVFSKDCIDVFETLKKKLTEAPILVVLDWNLPFELMCDASDFAIGEVLDNER